MGVIGRVLVFIGGAEILYGIYLLFDERFGPNPVWPHFAIGMLLGALGQWLLSIHKNEEIDRRTEHAEEILRLLRKSAKASPFSVYLRPFATTSKLLARNTNPISGSISPASAYTEKYVDIEALLAKALVDRVPLVSLGLPNAQLGAGKISVADTTWQENVALLLRHASIVFVVAGYQPGTRWELQHLKDLSDHPKPAIRYHLKTGQRE
jgi:hypothetical protein